MVAKQYIWLDGKYVDFEKANVHILTHSLQYASGVFEGIRAYSTEKGPAIFRLGDHAARFLRSARAASMDLGRGRKEIEDAVIGTVAKNGLKSCYIRPFAFYNDNRIGLNVAGKKVSVAIAAVDFGPYFQEKATGLRCRVSTWQRFSSYVLPPQAKLSGNYANSVLASIEATSFGCDEAILLSPSGHVAEGPGENIFLVEDNKLLTPSAESDILLGITRDSVLKMAESAGLEVEERQVHREELYTCDEAFFTGTAAEVTPIIEVDARKVGSGKTGPITRLLSERFSRIVHGGDIEYAHWLTYV